MPPTARRLPSAPLLWLACALCAGPAWAQEHPARPIPALPRAPRVDGDLKDLRGVPLRKMEGPSAAFSAQVAYLKDTLYLAVTVTDDQAAPGDVLDLTLFFPEAGATAQGHAFRFSADGQRSPEPELAAPVYAQQLVQVATKKSATGWTLEAAFPARVLPRIPTRDALDLELCLTYADRDEAGAKPQVLSNCSHGAAEERLRLPNSFRDALRLKPPAGVDGLEPRDRGWVGYGTLGFPLWVQADDTLTRGLLASMTADQPVNPESAHLGISQDLHLAGGRSIWTVVSGKDPYAVEGKCDAEKELRVGLYLVTGKTANRVLEWPVATCALGRAVTMGLEEDGALTVGYSNGATVNFAWSTDHFERTELGKR